MQRLDGVPAWAAIVFALLAAAASPSPAVATVLEAAIPDSPAGRQLAWLVSVLNRGGGVAPADAEARFVRNQAFPNAPVVQRMLRRAAQAVAPFRVVRVEEDPAGDFITAWIEAAKGVDRRIVVTTQPKDGDRIRDILWLPAEPVAPNEIGGRVFHFIRRGFLEGAPIELVDARTGRSFDPPRTTVTDFSGYWRLGVPEDSAPIAVRITHELLFDRLDTYAVLLGSWRGRDDGGFPALPRAGLVPAYRGLGLEMRSDEGTVAGFVTFTDPATLKNVAPTGCVTASLAPPSGRIGYPREFWTDLDPRRAHSRRDSGNWWALGIPPGSYTVVVRTGDREARGEIPHVFPDAVTTVWTPIFLASADDVPPPPHCD